MTQVDEAPMSFNYALLIPNSPQCTLGSIRVINGYKRKTRAQVRILLYLVLWV